MAVTFLTNEDKRLIDVEIENLSKENERLFEEVNDLKENGTGNGLTTEMVTALDNMFKVCAYSKEDISEEYGAFRKAFGLEEEPTPDVPVEPSGIIWSETPTHRLDCDTGKVSSGNNYVSELFPLEDGYVYEIKQPTGGAWLEYAVYNADGVFRYGSQAMTENGNKYVDGFDNNYIRLSINPKSEELDLSNVVPIKTDRLWSVGGYSADNKNGIITHAGLDNKITIRKIPVEGGSTYKFSTSGSHKWLKWLEYAEDGTYLGYKGDAETPKEFEATVSENATYIVLSMYGGEADADSYATFVKVVPDAPEQQTSLVYELAEPTTLNGSSDFIDTGVKLYDEDKDFEIMLEFTEQNFLTHSTLLHCMYESSPWQGLTIKHDGTDPNLLLTAIGSSKAQAFFNHSGVTRIALVKIGGYFTAKVMHEGIAEPQLVTEGTIGYKQYVGNLLIGAYQDTNGNKGRWFIGTISQCKVYVGDLPSDEETNAFLMGE